MMITRPDRQAGLRAPRPGQAGLLVADSIGLVARLTDRDRWILRMLHEHRVLTTNQLAALAFPTPNKARRRLVALLHQRVVDRFRPFRPSGSAPWHWVLAPAGAAVLAAEAGAEVRELGYRARRRLDIAHSLHLTHTIGVNDWFTTLTVTAKQHNAHVAQWWSEARCRRLWGDLARPDGFARYTHTDTRLDLFLEYDLGTTSLTRVAAKLLGYSELARSTGVITPILVWVPTSRREAALRHAMRDTATALPDPDAVPVATAAAELLNPAQDHPSPADRVWLPLDTTGTTRVRLHELADAWPRRTSPPPENTHTDHTPVLLGGQIMLTPPPPIFHGQ